MIFFFVWWRYVQTMDASHNLKWRPQMIWEYFLLSFTTLHNVLLLSYVSHRRKNEREQDSEK